jgi:hypothetical protein
LNNSFFDQPIVLFGFLFKKRIAGGIGGGNTLFLFYPPPTHNIACY